MKTILTRHILASLLLAAGGLFATTATAQQTVVIEPLFEYPMAPEELPTIEDKSTYLAEHFWDSFDMKGQKSVDQNALIDAMRVYTTALRFANRDKALPALDKLLEKASKNPGLLFQMTKAAEETMYGPRADVWIDEVYIRFVNALLKNKKIAANRRDKFAVQQKVLTACMDGAKAPEFSFTSAGGREMKYMPMSTPTILIFGDPSITDWRLARLRMDTNTALTQALDKGQANIVYIATTPGDGWKGEVASYPKTWTTGHAEGMSGIYDIRVQPSIYVVDQEGKIIAKNTSPEAAVNAVLGAIENQNR